MYSSPAQRRNKPRWMAGEQDIGWRLLILCLPAQLGFIYGILIYLGLSLSLSGCLPFDPPRSLFRLSFPSSLSQLFFLHVSLSFPPPSLTWLILTEWQYHRSHHSRQSVIAVCCRSKTQLLGLPLAWWSLIQRKQFPGQQNIEKTSMNNFKYASCSEQTVFPPKWKFWLA